MEYTVKKLAQLAGISSRTLRYYDEINLLKPKRINSSGYRIYGEKEINLLQLILLLREMDLPIAEIQLLLMDPNLQPSALLKKHHATLLAKKKHLENLLELVENSIASEERGEKMSDEAKFRAFKKQIIEENETQYGQEAREKYGADTLELSHQKIENWSNRDTQSYQENQAALKNLLLEHSTWEIPSPKAEEVYRRHKEFLMFHWSHPYDPATHKGISQLYVSDPRFTDYYTKFSGVGTAEKLQQVIEYYAK